MSRLSHVLRCNRLNYSIGPIITILTKTTVNIVNSKSSEFDFTSIYQIFKVSKSEKIRNRYIEVPRLTQDTNGKLTNSQLDTTNESQEVSPFTAGDHKAHINRRTQRHSKHKTERKPKRSTKEVPPWNGQ